MDETIDANEFVIFPGARSYIDSTLAAGSPGLLGTPVISRTPASLGSLTAAELQQIDDINTAFENTVKRRGQANGFVSWGGAISFNKDASWHYDYNTSPAAGKFDLYSVAIHELAHTLGFGTSAEWNALVTSSPSGSTFNGNAAKAKFGAPVPIAGGGGHWQEGLGSTVFGETQSQAAIMTPGLLPGNRKKFTALDAAALTDIGWDLIAPSIPGDYNHDGSVNAADYTVWRNTRGLTGSALAADGNHNNAIDAGDYTVWKSNFGQSASALGAGDRATIPEPAAAALFAIALLFAARLRVRATGSIS